MSSEIRNEDDLQAHIMENHYLEPGSSYAKVKRIAGEIISPEIDLLYIFETKEKQILTGYEFKFLRYKDNAVNYRHIYEGIGQAILYFQYGVDVCYLFLGFSNSITSQKEKLLNNKIMYLGNILYNPPNKWGQLGNRMNGFGVKIWLERSPHIINLTIKHEGSFPFHNFDEYRLNRQNLLSRKFAYDSKFLERYKR